MNEIVRVDAAPVQVFAAVAKATGQMKRIAKDSRNAEQKYDFASIDDFLAMVGPIYAANGLTTFCDEENVEPFERQGKYGPTSWLKIRFVFTTFHESGQSLPPARRTVEVIRTGAQSFGSAQSYALKQYLRGLHMIPTGDGDDADFSEKGTGAQITKTEPERPSQEYAAAHESAVTAAQAMIASADSLQDLQGVWKGLLAPVQADSRVIKAKDARKRELQATPPNSEIPY